MTLWISLFARMWLGLALWGAAQAACAEDAFLAPEQAFAVRAVLRDHHTVELTFDVAPGHHLYRERLQVTAPGHAAMLGEARFPAGTWIHDTGLDQDMEVYTAPVQVRVPLVGAPIDRLDLVVHYQGCADAGLCYPPQQATWRVQGDGRGWQAVVSVAAPVVPAVLPSPPPPRDESHLMTDTLRAGRWWPIVGLFFMAGVLLSFTPCVLPMVPILSSIIVGQQQPVSRSRGVSLSLAYALGMATVYTGFGVAAGLAGEGLAARLQQPPVLGAFALLLVLLALSMFGVYDLQLPSALQSRLSMASGRLRGGRHTGVFAMGGLSALIVGPCVAAPLAGALVFISQTRDVWIGGIALFALAVGMSVPLLVVGLSAGSLLPRAGAWMERVKSLFGVMLLAVAWWMVHPVLPAGGDLVVLSAGLLAAAAWAWQPGVRWRVAASLLLGIAGAAELVGALAGSVSPWRPLAVLVRPAAGGLEATQAEARDDLGFQRVRSLDELQQRLRQVNGPTVLDVYADWCVACKEMEALTFRDPAVRQGLRRFQRLQVDVTANDEQDRELLKRFGLFGPPGVLFFDAAGQEQQEARVVGFLAARAFAERLTAMAGS